MATITTSAKTEQNTSGALAALRPLAVDVAVPLAAYYAAHSLCGMGLVASLTVSSAVPAVRTVAALVRDRSVNTLALVMLVVNVAGILLSSVSGDPRLMIAKDGALSSVIGGSMIVTALLGRPLMSAGMRPFIVKGDAARSAAWDRLAAGSVPGSAVFRRNERAFSLVWGTVLVAECVAKVIAAYALPVETMVWLGTVMLVGAIGLGVLIGNVFAGRVAEQVIAEAGEAAELV
ncbi:VC0807 family protein [Kitasatospora sp. NPDC094015]|uniref:VC0807 family protein n=1 Tax=Kitasatospora sp. NPDC094015 TaxID=3155205 RepID=UPI003316A46A